MVLAARAVVAQARSIHLVADGAEHGGAFYKTYRDSDLASAHKVVNPGTTPLRAVVAVSGSPTVPEPAAKNGLSLTRQYFTQDGNPVDPDTVAQNTRLVVVIEAYVHPGATVEDMYRPELNARLATDSVTVTGK
jgi:uncharacterized protein YfaS (alpha-2-macroglobulin family)